MNPGNAAGQKMRSLQGEQVGFRRISFSPTMGTPNERLLVTLERYEIEIQEHAGKGRHVH